MNNTWYYRYTDDIDSKTIDSWFLSYNDTPNNETGNFTCYYDYIYYGPNKGPLRVFIHGEETRYYQSGYLVSTSIGAIPDNAYWGNIWADTSINENQSIYYQVIDANTEAQIGEHLIGNNISVQTINPETHPTLKLIARFITNGTNTPLLYGWSLNWFKMLYSGMTVVNNIHGNNFGIQSNASELIISENSILNNEIVGINISNCSANNNKITHMRDGMVKEVYMDFAGSYKNNFIGIPRRATITNASITIAGDRYIPESNMDQYFICQGWINDTMNEQSLNASISLEKPTSWENVFAYAYYSNLSYNNSSVTATEVNLSAWHNDTNISFTNNSTFVYVNSSIVHDIENPMVVNITTNKTNVKGNFTVDLFISNVTNESWNTTDYGFSTLITLIPPDVNITQPTLIIHVPNGGFAELNAYVVETNMNISGNFTIGYDSIMLDLTELAQSNNPVMNK